MNTSNTKNYDWLPRVMFLLCVIQIHPLTHTPDVTVEFCFGIFLNVLCTYGSYAQTADS